MEEDLDTRIARLFAHSQMLETKSSGKFDSMERKLGEIMSTLNRILEQRGLQPIHSTPTDPAPSLTSPPPQQPKSAIQPSPLLLESQLTANFEIIVEEPEQITVHMPTKEVESESEIKPDFIDVSIKGDETMIQNRSADIEPMSIRSNRQISSPDKQKQLPSLILKRLLPRNAMLHLRNNRFSFLAATNHKYPNPVTPSNMISAILDTSIIPVDGVEDEWTNRPPPERPRMTCDLRLGKGKHFSGQLPSEDDAHYLFDYIPERNFQALTMLDSTSGLYYNCSARVLGVREQLQTFLDEGPIFNLGEAHEISNLALLLFKTAILTSNFGPDAHNTIRNKIRRMLEPRSSNGEGPTDIDKLQSEEAAETINPNFWVLKTWSNQMPVLVGEVSPTEFIEVAWEGTVEAVDTEKVSKQQFIEALSTRAFLPRSVTSGLLGMKIATYENARTTLEAKKGIRKAPIIEFRSGTVMEFCIAAYGLLVPYIAVKLVKLYYGDAWPGPFGTIIGSGHGGSSVALFGRVEEGHCGRAADLLDESKHYNSALTLTAKQQTIEVFGNCRLYGENKDGGAKDSRIGLMAGEIHLAGRFTCSSLLNIMHMYLQPPLPKMQYLHPLTVSQLHKLRYQATQILSIRLRQAKVPLREEVAEYKLTSTTLTKFDSSMRLKQLAHENSLSVKLLLVELKLLLMLIFVQKVAFTEMNCVMGLEDKANLQRWEMMRALVGVN